MFQENAVIDLNESEGEDDTENKVEDEDKQRKEEVLLDMVQINHQENRRNSTDGKNEN